MRAFFQPFLGAVFLVAGVSAMANESTTCPSYFEGEYRKLHSTETVDLCELAKGKTLLVVNTASHCGFTSQFKGLEETHQRYKDQGLVVIGFASDDFNQEDPDEANAADICFKNFGVTFTMIAPTSVKGEGANALFRELAAQSKAPSWNFNKYVVGADGKVIEHFGSMTKPTSSRVTKVIDKALSL